MQVILKLEKDDIITVPFGENFAISPSKDRSIIFSRDAAEELISDLRYLLDMDPADYDKLPPHKDIVKKESD